MRIEPKKIMCALDFSIFTPLTLSYGHGLAREFDAKLFVCHIVSNTAVLSSHTQSYYVSERVTTQRMEDAGTALDDLMKKQDISAEKIVAPGHAADEIASIARENNIDLVITATHGGSGIKRFLIGSVTDRLVKILDCPLLVLHAKKESPASLEEFKIPLERILVGCDFSPGSGLAFEYGLSLAQEFQAELHLAHVIKPHKMVELGTADYIKIQEGDYPGWSRADFINLQENAAKDDTEIRNRLLNRLDRQLANMVPRESRNWCTPVTALLQGEPYGELITYAEQKKMDMIVLGVHGHSFLEQFLVGSTTDRVISRATCPVLAVRDIP